MRVCAYHLFSVCVCVRVDSKFLSSLPKRIEAHPRDRRVHDLATGIKERRNRGNLGIMNLVQCHSNLMVLFRLFKLSRLIFFQDFDDVQSGS